MYRNRPAFTSLLGLVDVEEFRSPGIILHYAVGIYELTATDSDSSFYC